MFPFIRRTRVPTRTFVAPAFAAVAALGACAAFAEEIGSVDTEFKLIGPDHKVVVEAFDDADDTHVLENKRCAFLEHLFLSR